jgi:hypothetical protein
MLLHDWVIFPVDRAGKRESLEVGSTEREGSFFE